MIKKISLFQNCFRWNMLNVTNNHYYYLSLVYIKIIFLSSTANIAKHILIKFNSFSFKSFFLWFHVCIYISYFSKVAKLQCMKGSVLVFQTWMPKQSFSRHLKCFAWSPVLISSPMKEKEPTFSLANKVGKGNIKCCLVLPCRVSWEFTAFDFSSLKVCWHQR